MPVAACGRGPSLSARAWPSDPFALFDALVRRGQGERAQRPRSDGAGHRRRRRPAVGADGAAEGPRPATASSSTPTLDSRKGDELAANPHAALLFHWKSLRRQVRIEGPVERGQRRPRPTPISPAAAGDSQLGAWASDQSRPLDRPRDLRSALRGDERRFEGGDVPRPPHWSGFRVDARSASNSGPTAPHRLHERRLFIARRRRLERRTALPMSGAHHHDHDHGHATHAERATLTSRAALASVAMALFLVGAQGLGGVDTGSMAMLGSLADTALDLIASLVTLLGVRIAAMPADERPSLRPWQGRGAGGAGPGHADHRVGARHRLARDRAAAAAASRRRRLELGIGVSLVAMAATLRAARLSAPRDRAHRIGRDRDRPCPLPVRPAAQPLGDRRACCSTSMLGLRLRRSAVRAARSRRGCCGARGARRASGRPADGPRMARGEARALPRRGRRYPELAGLHDLRTRTSGAHDFVQFHVWVPGDWTVREAHDRMDRGRGEARRRASRGPRS